MEGKKKIRGLPSALRAFVSGEASGGLLLMGVAALALVIANSPWFASYFAALHAKVGGLSVLHWINDGLMAVFFLLVGLEIKREMIEGQLSTWRRRALPGLAALGGMIAPALVYLSFNLSEPAGLRGWAIPAATDIAFALGVLALLGPRAPGSLKIFLTALAIIDDLGAVAIIALFYTSELSGLMLAGAGATLAGLFVLNRLGVARLAVYMPLGLVLWFFTLKSGVHATVAGVLLALAIPLRASRAEPHRGAPLHRLEHALHPWAAFFIVPVFGFANAGVSFSGVTLATLAQPVPLGVAAGLFIGKQVGVFGFAWAAVKFGLAAWPRHASLAQVYGVALLCGIGFTMSLFIGALAFSDPALQDQTKIGVLVGSLLSGLAGYALLRAQPVAAAPVRTGV